MIKRKYDLGNGVTIEDDGHWISATHKKDEKSSCSIGVKRPKEFPEIFKVIVSRDTMLYYLHDFTDMHGFWLSFNKFDNQEAATVQSIYGKEYAYIKLKSGEEYWRQMYSFNCWSIKSDHVNKELPFDCDEVKDYLAIQNVKDKEQEARFNDVIAPSGRDLAWIIGKIGPWVPVEELPIVRLE